MKKIEIIELINMAVKSKEMCRIFFKYNYYYSYHFPLITSDKLFLSANEDDFIMIKISHGNDKGSFGLAQLSIYNEKSGPSITFQYNVDDPMNPDDSLYKFLMELEKYVPDEDKDKIIPQWR